jgi:NitT/TauT family transport system ATP-binding protein
MDEPFSALDPNTRLRLRQQLVDLWQETHKTVVFVTHDVDEALFLADRILVLCAKPARVVETITVTAARPRQIETEPALRTMRADLFDLFKTIEQQAGEHVS